MDEWMRESQDSQVAPATHLLLKIVLYISSDRLLTTIQGSSPLIQAAQTTGICVFHNDLISFAVVPPHWLSPWAPQVMFAPFVP